MAPLLCGGARGAPRLAGCSRKRARHHTKKSEENPRQIRGKSQGYRRARWYSAPRIRSMGGSGPRGPASTQAEREAVEYCCTQGVEAPERYDRVNPASDVPCSRNHQVIHPEARFREGARDEESRKATDAQPPRGAPPVGGRRLGAGRMLALPVSAGRRGHHVDSHAGMSTSVVTGTLRSTLGRVREMSTTKFVVALWFALLVPLQGYG